jgi:outer membrane protein OmpA-like peptidoglycan-associated protein
VTAATGQAGVTCPAPADRPGYAFTGWFTQASGGDLVSLPLVLKNNTTIFGRWTADVVVTNEKVVVYFKWDSSKLSTNAKNDLKEFVKSIPTNASDIEIDVTGFAQIARSRTYDLKLSLKRAQAIVSYLRSLGVQATFTTTGMGWENDSPESRRGDIQIEYTLNP